MTVERIRPIPAPLDDEALARARRAAAGPALTRPAGVVPAARITAEVVKADTAVQVDRLKDLLASAAIHPRQKIRTLAVRIQSQIKQLDELLADTARQVEAQRRVDALREQLAVAEQELRKARGVLKVNRERSDSGTTRKPDYDCREIRAWARETGYPGEVPATGPFLPSSLVQAWRAATGGDRP